MTELIQDVEHLFFVMFRGPLDLLPKSEKNLMLIMHGLLISKKHVNESTTFMCSAALVVMTYTALCYSKITLFSCWELAVFKDLQSVKGAFNGSLFVAYQFNNFEPELPSSRGEDLQTKCLLELYGLKVIFL